MVPDFTPDGDAIQVKAYFTMSGVAATSAVISHKVTRIGLSDITDDTTVEVDTDAISVSNSLMEESSVQCRCVISCLHLLRSRVRISSQISR